MKQKYAIGLIIFVAGVVLLIAGNFKKTMQYYLTVDELFASPELVRDKEFRLSGKVIQGSIVKANPEKPRYEFQMENGGKQISVVYNGFAPDTFRDDSSVVVRGRFDEKTRVFTANHLLAKCASKYEAKLDEKPPGA